MRLTRGKIQFIALVLILFFGWKHLARSSYETIVLHTPSVRNWDTYTTLWVVDDEPNLWIRAESRDRIWLEFLRSNPRVELRRGGQTLHYQANTLDTDNTRAYVDAKFRAKYGLADELRALLIPRETVPIRLERP